MISTEEKKVISTLIYSDLFDFPLSFDELYKLLISDKKVSKKSIYKVVENSKNIEEKDGLHFLRGRKSIVNLRKRREKESKLKIKNSSFLFKLIGTIPTILMIGISGSVAVGNAKKIDDIDLFIITKKNSLWLSRFLIIFLLFVFNKKRRVRDKVSPDKICINMLLDEAVLPINKRNLFIAKEVVQVLPVINKQHIYEKFLYKNIWIKKYIANYNISKPKNTKQSKINPIVNFMDNFLFFVQKKYMLNKITNEKIGKHFAWFHPDDKSSYVIEKFEERILKIKNVPKKAVLNKTYPQSTKSYNAILTPGY